MDRKLRQLPLDERIKLVDELWESIFEDQASLPVTQAQKDELDRRQAAYEKDGDPGRPAFEALEEIRRKL